MMALMAADAVAVEVVAHRGASHLAPENTLASVRLGWKLGADAVEVDVFLSSDGRIVAIHDETTARTTGVDLDVARTPASRLRRLDAGAWKAPKYAGERIPYLEEVLETVPAGKRLLVEVKCGPAILPRLERVLDASGKRGQVMIISFNFEVAAGARRRMPDVPALWLKSTEKDESSGAPRPHDPLLVERARAARLAGLGVHHAGVEAVFVRAVRDAGLKLYVWTVDDPAEARRLLALGIDGLITNRPGWMRGQLEGGKSR